MRLHALVGRPRGVRRRRGAAAWRAPRSVEESRSAFVRNACAKRDVYVLRGAWAADECDALAAAACAAAEARGGWSRARHSAFPTRDLPADALPADVAEALHAAVRHRVLRPAAARRDPSSELSLSLLIRRPSSRAAFPRAGFDRTDDLEVRDLFIINYEARLSLCRKKPCLTLRAAQAAEGGQAALELHRDASLLSFNMLLSDSNTFTGGGTAFPHLARCSSAGEDSGAPGWGAAVADAGGVVRLAQGDACVHGGGVLHGGCAVTSGRRLLLVGFVDSRRDARPRAIPADTAAAH